MLLSFINCFFKLTWFCRFILVNEPSRSVNELLMLALPKIGVANGVTLNFNIFKLDGYNLFFRARPYTSAKGKLKKEVRHHYLCHYHVLNLKHEIF